MRFLKFIHRITHRVLEEIFPFIYLIFNILKVRSKPILCDTINSYSTLSIQDLLDRLKEEQKRGAIIEEKTFKFHGSFAAGFTLVNSTLFLLTEKISYPGSYSFLYLLLSFSVLYLFFGAFIALYGIKNHRVYGYGTEFLVKLNKNKDKDTNICSEALVRQENENIIRNLRNEASFQSVRNSLFCFFMAILCLSYFILSN